MCNNNLTYETKEIVNDSNTSVDSTDVDNVSLEILWQPQCGEKITADIIFIHGLHGKHIATQSLRVIHYNICICVKHRKFHWIYSL